MGYKCFMCCSIDAIFFLFEDGKLAGLVGAYVDDLFAIGDPRGNLFKTTTDELKKVLLLTEEAAVPALRQGRRAGRGLLDQDRHGHFHRRGGDLDDVPGQG